MNWRCSIYILLLSLMLNNVSLIASYRMVRQFSYFTKCRYLHSKSTNEVKRDKILVIVESPAKARTIQTFLPSNYVVDFCSGHVRDLVKDPKDAPDECKLKYVIDSFKLNEARLGIRVSDNFKPIYSMLEGKSNIVQRLKDICEHSSSVLLATDEDREGEAISWHLLQLLNPKVPVKRAVFHEISKEAILKSFENARDLNLDLVRSQEARRMLDRLTGYSISPLLWRYVSMGLSAGRVQSCGLKLLAEREAMRWSFKSNSYYSVHAHLTGGEPEPAGVGITDMSPAHSGLYSLQSLDGAKVVSSEKDLTAYFDHLDVTTRAGTGTAGGAAGVGARGAKDPGKHLVLLDQEKATQVMKWCASTDVAITIAHTTKKFQSRSAPEPFTTSTLQQETSKKLKFSPKFTMMLAQKLYEKGLITYMRTDSSTISDEAKNIAREYVLQVYGSKYWRNEETETARKKKVVKNAQEAHEAIRPVIMNSSCFTSPLELKNSLTSDEWRLYTLIFDRSIASVMSSSKSCLIAYTAQATSNDLRKDSEIKEAIFRLSTTIMLFDGFQAVQNRRNGNIKVFDDDASISLPVIDCVGHRMTLRREGLVSSSVDEPSSDDEEAGGARPDTDAESEVQASSDRTIICQENDAIEAKAHETKPPPRYTEASFIHTLETIGVGRPSTYSSILHTLQEREYINVDQHVLVPTIRGMVVSRFLETNFPRIVDPTFTSRMEQSLDDIASGVLDATSFLREYYLTGSDGEIGLLPLVETKLAHEALDLKVTRSLPIAEYNVTLHYNRGGSCVTKQGFDGVRWTLPVAMQTDMQQITRENIENVTAGKTSEGSIIGSHPTSGLPIQLRFGMYGRYLQIGNSSLPKKEIKKFNVPSRFSEDFLSDNISLVLEYSSLPRVVGEHPVLHLPVILSVKDDRLCLSVKGYPFYAPVDDNLLPNEVTLELASEYLRDTSKILKTQIYIGLSEEDGNQPIFLKTGRFGPYVQCGSHFASVKKAANIDSITLEEALALLNKRRRVAKKIVATQKVALPPEKGIGKGGKKKKTLSAPVFAVSSTKVAGKKSSVPSEVLAEVPSNVTGYKTYSEEYLSQHPSLSLKEASMAWKSVAAKDKKLYRAREAEDAGRVLAAGRVAKRNDTEKTITSTMSSSKRKMAHTINHDISVVGAKKKLTSYQVFVKRSIREKGLNISSAAVAWKALTEDQQSAFTDE